MSSIDAPSDAGPTVYCARHPRVETVLRCGKCGTPICPKCMIHTPVGARCRTCARVKRFATVARPAELARAAGLGVAVAAVGSLVVLSLPFLALFGLAALGYLVGEAVSVAANRKRATEVALVAVASLVVGFALGPLLADLLGGRPPRLELLPLLLVAPLFNPLLLVGLLVGGLLAWMRCR